MKQLTAAWLALLALTVCVATSAASGKAQQESLRMASSEVSTQRESCTSSCCPMTTTRIMTTILRTMAMAMTMTMWMDNEKKR